MTGKRRRAQAIVTMLTVGAAVTLLSGCDTISDFAESFRKQPEVEREVTWSQGAPPPDRKVALVLDNSGSMKNNDERGMMLFSSLVFLDMLAETDELFVTSFPGKDTVPSDRLPTAVIDSLCERWIYLDKDRIGPLRNSPDGNADLKDWVRNLTYTSQVTVFREPLQRAVNALTGMQPSDAKRYVVLFTDGNTDRGGERTPTNMARAHDRERGDLLPYRDLLVRNNIIFYGVVLGQATRDDHLAPLAQATGGAILRADSPADLHDKFAEVFGKILETRVDKINLTDSSTQTVNRYVKELILFLPTSGADLTVDMKEPGGRRLDGSLAGDDGFIRRDGVREIEPYQVIHVSDPKPGKWQFGLNGADSAKALMIQNYDVYLQINGRYPRRGMMNMPNQVVGRLVDSRGEPLEDPAFFAEGTFRYGIAFQEQQEESPHDQNFAFEFEITPRDTLLHDLTCTATNGEWLTRTVTVPFGGKDGVILRVNNDADFGSVVPYADGMYFWWCRWVSKALGLPAAGNWKTNTARVEFKGTDEALKGVVFRLDEQAISDEHHMRLVDSRHRARFVIGEDYSASFRLDVERNARALDGRLEVPIVYPTDAGKIRGDKTIGVVADVRELNWAWRTSHLWLQWLIYLWIFLFFIYRPLHYVFGYSTRNVRYKPRESARRFTRPHPSENSLTAFLKALLLMYPLGLVTGLKKTPGKSYVDGSGGSKARRALLLLAGLPVGPYLRPLKARVGNHSATFYKNGRDLLMNKAELERLRNGEAPQDRKQLTKAPRTIAYPVHGGESNDTFRISNQ
jgi:hypothetical protein